MKNGDKILIFLIISISFASIVFIQIDRYISNNTELQKNAVLWINGDIIQRIPLTSDYKRFTFNFAQSTGTLEIESNSIRMTEMDESVCPKKICSGTGWINSTYQSIVCLPNKIVVTIETIENRIDEKQVIDAISLF